MILVLLTKETHKTHTAHRNPLYLLLERLRIGPLDRGQPYIVDAPRPRYVVRILPLAGRHVIRRRVLVPQLRQRVVHAQVRDVRVPGDGAVPPGRGHVQHGVLLYRADPRVSRGGHAALARLLAVAGRDPIFGDARRSGKHDAKVSAW